MNRRRRERKDGQQIIGAVVRQRMVCVRRLRLEMRRRLGATVIGLALTLVLTGCESGFFQGPVAIRSADNDLLVAICVDAQVMSVSGSERQSGLLRSWEDFWIAEGEIDVVAGTVFSVSGNNTGLVAELNRVPELDRGDELDISFVDADASVVDAVLVVGEEGVPHEGWLQSDGSVTNEPCP